MGRRVIVEVVIPAAAIDRLDELIIGTAIEPTAGLYPALDRGGCVLEEMSASRLVEGGPVTYRFQVWCDTVAKMNTLIADLDTTRQRFAGATATVISNVSAPTSTQEQRNAPPPYF